MDISLIMYTSILITGLVREHVTNIYYKVIVNEFYLNSFLKIK